LGEATTGRVIWTPLGFAVVSGTLLLRQPCLAVLFRQETQVIRKNHCWAFASATAVVTGCLLVGCASAPTVSASSNPGLAARAGDDALKVSFLSEVRIEAIQRIDSDSGDAVT
jgi:hypothetical protein